MKIFSIVKIDDEYSVKHYPLGDLRLNPRAVSPNQSSGTTAPIDGVSVILIRKRVNILSMYILNNLRMGNILHLFH
jgi:hypothetical protein